MLFSIHIGLRSPAPSKSMFHIRRESGGNVTISPLPAVYIGHERIWVNELSPKGTALKFFQKCYLSLTGQPGFPVLGKIECRR
jgi:hypothetical protein